VLIAKRSIATLLAASSILICGCNSGNQEVGSPQAKATSTSSAPVTSAEPSEQKILAVKDATPAYQKAKAAYDAAKGDAKLKGAYIEATNALADANLYADELAPRVKYPAALKFYREVLSVDPKNEHAMKESQQIVDIYKSMGRPVPGEGK
jgi:hypothetical protein